MDMRAHGLSGWFSASDSKEVWTKRAKVLQGVRPMKFESVLDRWQVRQLSQAEATVILGVSERTFRRWRDLCPPFISSGVDQER